MALCRRCGSENLHFGAIRFSCFPSAPSTRCRLVLCGGMSKGENVKDCLPQIAAELRHGPFALP